MLIYGVHPCEEMLQNRPDRVLAIQIARADSPNLAKIRELAARHAKVITRVEPAALDALAEGGNHQGVVLETAPFNYAHLDELLAKLADKPRACFVVLEQVQDPGNLGAILRSAAAMGVDAVLIPKDRAVAVTPAVIRASAGLAYSVAVARVTNVARSLQTLREHNFWAVAATAEGATDLWDIDLDMRVALVLGGEHGGIRRLVAENCDFRARIPMAQGVESLNVASAASIFLYELRRQWHKAAAPKVE
ncbi:MAG: 23S rRNA (guanosine(2251)-2'-O)-methyltransferase RlmB [Bradymonadaceae bacterium]|nr:23S rRNA (guanosine(2251)-2'-O)-methyltransferase RlmB [Lujinxingiaceae bacterium]